MGLISWVRRKFGIPVPEDMEDEEPHVHMYAGAPVDGPACGAGKLETVTVLFETVTCPKCLALYAPRFLGARIGVE